MGAAHAYSQPIALLSGLIAPRAQWKVFTNITQICVVVAPAKVQSENAHWRARCAAHGRLWCECANITSHHSTEHRPHAFACGDIRTCVRASAMSICVLCLLSVCAVLWHQRPARATRARVRTHFVALILPENKTNPKIYNKHARMPAHEQKESVVCVCSFYNIMGDRKVTAILCYCNTIINKS